MKLWSTVFGLLAGAVLVNHLFVAPAVAWGDDGHRIIALIAEHYLDPQARAKVDRLLAADKDPLTAPDFANRATWADKFRAAARSGSSLAYRGPDQWHFTDVEIDAPDLNAACYGRKPLDADTPASHGPEDACAVDKIIQFAAELADSNTSVDEQLLAFKFLVHLVGDIHQPLHSADNHDRGGNSTFVVLGEGITPRKLHAYWDTGIVHKIGNSPEFVASAMVQQFGANRTAWSSGTPQEWAMEAFAKARDCAYQLGRPVGQEKHGAPVYRINQDYEDRAHLIAREQLTKAGMRLAATLNRAFTGE